MEAGIFIAAVLYLVLAYFIAAEFGSIAEAKGHPKGKYTAWSFFCGPVGWFMVVALPDRAAAPAVSAVSAAPAAPEELPDL